MDQKPLGSTGVMVPEIGVGVWRYGGGVEPLRRAIDLGASLIDTAEAYGTEKVVGEAVRNIRDRVFIATKVSGSHLRHDEVLRAAEASLERLNTDYIDLYQIHWPNSMVPIGETMRAMEALVDRGLVKHIGVSNFSTAELRAAQAAMTNHPIAANQVLYNLNRRQIEIDLMPYCDTNRITILAYTPLDSGRLARDAGSSSNPAAMTVLEQVAAETHKSNAQVVLNWCVAHPGVVAIPKSDKAARVAENCGAAGWRLSAAQMKLLDRAFSALDDD
ncbi:MAG TPA: aldo/keto reductase [Candidatus Binataceae bacterium]|nr:aldo/keto reductase [Candidatus Binataceae bacterium]